MGRQEAHELTRQLSIKSKGKEGGLKTALLAEKKASKFLTKKDVDRAMDPMSYLGAKDEIIDRMRTVCK
jgi:adenylosuccinate lyase